MGRPGCLQDEDNGSQRLHHQAGTQYSDHVAAISGKNSHKNIGKNFLFCALRKKQTGDNNVKRPASGSIRMGEFHDV